MIDIRPADLPDCPVLARLSEQLGYPVDADRVAARLLPLIDARDHQVLVARIGDEVVGWIHVFATERLESEPFAELGGLVVSKMHRRDGIGRALVSAAEAWARDRDLGRLRARSNVVRSDAHRFYRALGFEDSKRQTVFTRDLRPGAE